MQKHQEDEFFGEQDEQDDDHTTQHGAMGQHDLQSEHAKRHNLSYHESFDESKELKLQDGFEKGYRAFLPYAQEIGSLLGKRVYLQHSKTDSSLPSIIASLKDFLEREQTSDQRIDQDQKLEQIISMLKIDE
jgi:hypothetical protein